MLRSLASSRAGCRRCVPGHLRRRISPWAVAVLATAAFQAVCTSSLKAETRERPNVILIMTDDR